MLVRQECCIFSPWKSFDVEASRSNPTVEDVFATQEQDQGADMDEMATLVQFLAEQVADEQCHEAANSDVGTKSLY